VHITRNGGRNWENVTPKGVVVAGVEYELDCLIYATGFEVGTDYSRRAGCEIYGRDGVSLTQRWAAGVRTLHGMHSRGFPNCFIMGPQQAGFTVNFPHMLNERASTSPHLKHAVDRGADDRGVGSAEAGGSRRSFASRSLPSSSSRTARRGTTTTKASRRNAAARMGSTAAVRWVLPHSAQWRSTGGLPGLSSTDFAQLSALTRGRLMIMSGAEGPFPCGEGQDGEPNVPRAPILTFPARGRNPNSLAGRTWRTRSPPPAISQAAG
jgi:cyclohexanone monooxygenase